MRASDVMEGSVVTVSPELGIGDFEELLSAQEISGAPVTDADGQLVGIASQTDVLRALSEEHSEALRELREGDLTVSDIMTEDVVVLPPDTEVRTVAQTMIDARVHRVLVGDKSEVLGIISAFDLLALIARGQGT